MGRVTLHIGSLAIDPPVVLAPMAGVTDAPFRLVCAEQGGGLYVSEMVSARGLAEGNAKSWAMARHHPAESIRSLQLYGSEPAVMAEAVDQLIDRKMVDHIDLNFGCPVAKITRNGGGAALPVKRRLFGRVVAAAVKAAGPVAVTVKMRMGLDDDRLTYLDAGRIAGAHGAAAVALHARTAAQGYTGQAQWRAIAALKDAVGDEIPVLGNGDIWDAEDALKMMAATGCDGVVIGRGCLGRPWLFADLAAVLQGTACETDLGPPPLGVITHIAQRHLQLAMQWQPDEISTLRRFRKHLRWYLQGYPVGRSAHARAGTVKTVGEVETLFATLDPTARVVAGSERAPRGRTGSVGRMVLPQGWCDDPDEDVDVPEMIGAASGG